MKHRYRSTHFLSLHAVALIVLLFSSFTGNANTQPLSASPGVTEGWRLTLIDEFNGTNLNTNIWERVTQLPFSNSAVKSARLPQNVIVENGTARFLTKSETFQHPERDQTYDWTSGYMQTKVFQQRYGYWDSSMRIAASTGLNNAFWATTNGTPPATSFELDIVEAHYPANPHFNFHAWRWPDENSKRAYPDSINDIGYNLHDSFHTYAMLWTEGNDIVYYVDGVEYHRVVPNASEPNLGGPDGPADIKYSTAVMTFGGPIVPELDGTSMDVDWVRVFGISDHLMAEESFESSSTFHGGDGWFGSWNAPEGSEAYVAGSSLDPNVAGYKPGKGAALDLGSLGTPIERQIDVPNRFSYDTDATWFISFLVKRSAGSGMRLELVSGGNVRGMYEIDSDGTIGTAMTSAVTSSESVPVGEDTLITIMIKARPSWTSVFANGDLYIENDEVYSRTFTPGQSMPASAPLLNEWHTKATGGSSVTPSTVRLVPLGSGALLVDEIRLGNTFASVTRNTASGICPADANFDGTTDTTDLLLYLNSLEDKLLWTDYSGDGAINGSDAIRYLDLFEQCSCCQ
ncbi:MAG: family 16 glycosylhydrolase [Planctomycetota bacterium]